MVKEFIPGKYYVYIREEVAVSEKEPLLTRKPFKCLEVISPDNSSSRARWIIFEGILGGRWYYLPEDLEESTHYSLRELRKELSDD